MRLRVHCCSLRLCPLHSLHNLIRLLLFRVKPKERDHKTSLNNTENNADYAT